MQTLQPEDPLTLSEPVIFSWDKTLEWENLPQAQTETKTLPAMWSKQLVRNSTALWKGFLLPGGLPSTHSISAMVQAMSATNPFPLQGTETWQWERFDYLGTGLLLMLWETGKEGKGFLMLSHASPGSCFPAHGSDVAQQWWEHIGYVVHMGYATGPPSGEAGNSKPQLLRSFISC